MRDAAATSASKSHLLATCVVTEPSWAPGLRDLRWLTSWRSLRLHGQIVVAASTCRSFMERRPISCADSS